MHKEFRIILLLMMFLFFVNFIRAESLSELSSIGEVKQGENILLKGVCDLGCSYVYVDVIYNNNENLLIGGAMSSIDTYNWEYNFANTSKIGIYKVCLNGDDGGLVSQYCYTFEVTPDGLSSSIRKSDIYYFSFLGLATFLGIIFVIFGYSKNKKLLLISSIPFLINGVSLLFYPTGINNNFITISLSIIFLGFGIFFLADSIDEWIGGL